MTSPSQPVANPQIAGLFPRASVAVAELWGSGDERSLDAAEAPLIASAVAKRRAEFAAGRQCVRHAMDQLGRPPSPLLIGEKRSPLWPDDVVGAISHTDGYAVAVVGLVGHNSAAMTVGIDAEHVGRVVEHLYDRLFTEAEIEYLTTLNDDARNVSATVMFGAKEAFYKAQFVRTGAWVGFHDVELSADGDAFTMRRATDLDVLAAFEWPIRARSLINKGITVTGIEARSG